MIGRFATSPIVFAVHADSPYKTFADLVKDIQARPGKLNYGTGGNGTPGHMGFEALAQRITGLDAQSIPFKGANESNDCGARWQGTRLRVGPDDVGRDRACRPDSCAGGIRTHTFSHSSQRTDGRRIRVTAGFSFVNWIGIYAPAKTPANLIAGLRTALANVASEPDFKTSVETLGWDLYPSESPEAFSTFFKQSLTRETELVKKLGLTMTS